MIYFLLKNMKAKILKAAYRENKREIIKPIKYIQDKWCRNFIGYTRHQARCGKVVTFNPAMKNHPLIQGSPLLQTSTMWLCKKFENCFRVTVAAGLSQVPKTVFNPSARQHHKTTTWSLVTMTQGIMSPLT